MQSLPVFSFLSDTSSSSLAQIPRRARRYWWILACCQAVGKCCFSPWDCARMFSLFFWIVSGIVLTLCSSLLSQKSIGLPDIHSGYGFAIGNVAGCM
jgi:hypothetical protein